MDTDLCEINGCKNKQCGETFKSVNPTIKTDWFHSTFEIVELSACDAHSTLFKHYGLYYSLFPPTTPNDDRWVVIDRFTRESITTGVYCG